MIHSGVYFALGRLGNEYVNLGGNLCPPGVPFGKLKWGHDVLLHLNSKRVGCLGGSIG